MKRLIAIAGAIIIIANSSYAAFTKQDTTGLQQAFVPAQGSTVAGENLSSKEYEQLTGQHLNFVQRLAFKVVQKQWQRKFEKDKTGKRFRFGGFLAVFYRVLPGLYWRQWPGLVVFLAS